MMLFIVLVVLLAAGAGAYYWFFMKSKGAGSANPATGAMNVSENGGETDLGSSADSAEYGNAERESEAPSSGGAESSPSGESMGGESEEQK